MRDNNFHSTPIENRKAAVTLDSFGTKRGAPLFKGIVRRECFQRWGEEEEEEEKEEEEGEAHNGAH